LDNRYRASVGLLTHTSFLYENLTGYENLSFFGALYGIKNLKQNIAALATFFKVDDRMNEPVRDLSRGLKQRLSIMRLLIHDPDIIILDEPFTGLDEMITKKLHHMLEKKQKAGKHILITTHNLRRGYESASKVGILAHGTMQFETKRDSITFDELKRTYKQMIQHETV
jgi:heme exporter protein A